MTGFDFKGLVDITLPIHNTTNLKSFLMKNQLTLLFCLMGLTSPVFAQLNFSGSIDTYYRVNINADREQSPNTSFANLPGFALGMANLVGSYEGEKVGFVADLVFGPRGEEAVFNSVGSANIVNQLYAYWKVSPKITLTIGNFNTFLGYEVISPASNFNYSTSYMFSYGPFSHTGVKADFALSDDFSLMLAALNPTDYTEFNVNGKTTFGAQLGFKGQYLNLLFGDQSMDESTGSLFQIDYTGGFNLGKKLYLGINSTYNSTPIEGADDTGFYGVAAYLQLQTGEKTAFGFRPEYFAEFGNFGALGNTDLEGKANVLALTLSGNLGIAEGLKLIPEFRFDINSEPIYTSDTEIQSELGSFVIAAVYSF